MRRHANALARSSLTRAFGSVALLVGGGVLQAQSVQLPVPPATSLTLSSPTTYSGTTITAAGNNTTVSIANGANVVFNATTSITLKPGFTAGSLPPGSGTTFKASIVAPPPPLQITTSGTLQNGTVGASYSQTLNAIGGVPPYGWQLISTSQIPQPQLPPGIGPSITGVIAGIPVSTGGWVFTMQVYDAAGDTAQAVFGISINPATNTVSLATTSPLPSGTTGSYYSQTLIAAGGTSPYTWSQTSGTLPPGLGFSGGVLSGTPTSSGSWTFGVQVSDIMSHTATGSFSVSISAPSSPVTITTTSPLPGGQVGVAYLQSFLATGGTGPYTWSSTGGTIPPGLQLTSAGALSGAPTATGSYSFTMQAKDALGHTQSGSFSVTISAAPPVNITSESTLPTAILGASYRQMLTAAGGVSPYTWSSPSGSLPPGIHLWSNGLISGTGTGTQAGSYTFAATVTDTTNATFAANITIPTTTSTTAAATISAPTLGTVISLNPTLTWTSGSGAYRLMVGSNPGASDIYATPVGPSQSATFTVPSSAYVVYVNLDSMVAGAFQTRSYAFLTQPAVPDQETDVSTGVDFTYNDNLPSHDAQGPVQFKYRFYLFFTNGKKVPWDADTVEECSVTSGEDIAVNVSLSPNPSEFNVFLLSYTAPYSTPTGLRNVTCSADTPADNTDFPVDQLDVYDGTPVITSIAPSGFVQGAAGVNVAISGHNFGTNPNQITVSTPGISVGTPQWTDNLIQVPFTVASTVQPGTYTVTVTSGGTGASGFLSGGQTPSSAQSNGASIVVVGAPTPTISSLSPNSGVVGTQLTITASGTGLSGVSSVNVTSNGKSAQGIVTAVDPGDDGTAFVTMDLTNTTVMPGTYNVSLVSYGISTNALPFTVGDTTPIITSVNQTTPLSAGGQDSIVVSGNNFGPPCVGSQPCPGAAVAVCKQGASSCTSSDVTPTINTWSNTQITAQLAAGSTASGFYDVQVTSAGASGKGFAPAQGTQVSAQSNRWSVAVTGQSNVTLQVTMAGNTQANACAYIDPTPQMPQITAQIVNKKDNTPVTSGTATWQLITQFLYYTRDVVTNITSPTGYQISTPPSPDQKNANQVWTVPFASTQCDGSGQPSCFFGGNAALNWTYNGVAQPTFEFQICAENPAFGDASAAITAQPYWFMLNLTIHETNAAQFCQAGVAQTGCNSGNAGMPIFGQPAGYGMFQLDPVPSIDALWNWQSNLAGAKALLDGFAGPVQDKGDGDKRAYPFWIGQVRHWRLFNASASQNAQAPPPPEDMEGTTASSCVFVGNIDSNNQTSPTSNTGNTHWFGDAILMKNYAAGYKVPYIQFVNGGWPLNPLTHFVINGQSYTRSPVREFCTCSSIATCQHSTP